MATYSFLNTQAAIKDSTSGVNFSLSAGAGLAEEGISISRVEDKVTTITGADGQGMHSLHAGNAGTVSVRLLKTSPTNRLLQALYNIQTTSSALTGNTIISIRDQARGDSITCFDCAFKKAPDIHYAKEGGIMEWAFNSVRVETILGDGRPALS